MKILKSPNWKWWVQDSSGRAERISVYGLNISRILSWWFYKYHVYLYNMFVLSSTQFYRSCGRFYGHNKLWKKSLNNNGSQALVARTTPLFSNFLFTNLFSIKFLYFFIISSLFPYFNLFVSIFIQSHVNIKLHVSTLYRY